jgi:hypothetical protein
MMAAADEKKAVIYNIPCVATGGVKTTVQLIYVPELKILINKDMHVEIVEYEFLIISTRLVPHWCTNVYWGVPFGDYKSIRIDKQPIVISLKLFKFIEKIAKLERELFELRDGISVDNMARRYDFQDLYRLYHKN